MKTFSSTHWKNRLRQERIQRNWRQQDLADQLGTTVVTVKRWERGSHQPSAYFRVKLCALFGKSAEELFGEPINQEQETSLLLPPQISQPDSDLTSEPLEQTFTNTKSTFPETTIQKTSVSASYPRSVSVDTSGNGVFPPPRRHHFSKSSFLLMGGTLVLLSLLVVLATVFKPIIFVLGGSSVRSFPPQNRGEVQDQNLLIELIGVVSPSFVLPDDPNHYLARNILPTSISAVLLAKNTISYCNIIIALQNLRLGGADILIDSVALKLQHIPIIPRPLRAWTPGVSTTYDAYPYPITYKGQSQNQLLYAVPSQNVILQPAKSNHPGESNQLSIQVMSTLTAFLQFQIQVSYQIANDATVYTLLLPQTFQVIFSDASNWQEYLLQKGVLVRKP